MRLYCFVVTEFVPPEFEVCTFCACHPFVVEINNVTVRTVIDNERNYFAFSNGKFLRKFQNITDCSPSKTIQALVIIANYTNIFTVPCKKKYNLFLNKVCVLIFVNHDVRNLGAKFFQDFHMVFKQMVGFNLNRRKVHQIVFCKNFAIFYQYSAKSRNGFVGVGDQLIWIHQLFGETVYVVANRL